MKSSLSTYKNYLKKNLIKFDPNQETAMKDIDEFLSLEFSVKPKLYKNFLKRRKSKNGIYLYGEAGVGKTMLMDICFSSIKIKKKKRIHFQEFMIDIHNRLHKIRNSKSIKDPLITVAEEVASEIKFLCFDEFQVTDIADASILKKLFTVLFEHGTIIFSTSNIKPSNLYSDGLHRDRFLPFIDYLENDCLVININSGKDYRKNRVINAEVYYSPLGNSTEEAMNKIFNSITNGLPYEEKILFVKGREIRIERQALGCARFDFQELCAKPLGAEDYLAISNEFDVIFIENIPILPSEKRNEAKRFVSLIDALYDNRKRVFISAEGQPDEIYKKGDSQFEFKRCVSRLHEMRSKEYL
tara:strand:- start:706 stop:1773 length:1068 start_codon:yes stop_codon:yes gene_type:complete